MAYAIESKTKGSWNFFYSCFCEDVKKDDDEGPESWSDIETNQRFFAEEELKSAKIISEDSVLKHYSELEV
jgi:hypothetical protein